MLDLLNFFKLFLLNFKFYSVHLKIGSKLGGKWLMAKKKSSESSSNRNSRNKNKKCAKCGIIVKSYSYGDFCDTCAEEVWDKGFDSTTQHAEEIYEQNLKDEEEINKKINKTKISYNVVRDLIEYKSGTFRCSKCNKLRLEWIPFPNSPIKDEKLRLLLKTSCPKCKVVGYLKFV
jgi:hypothetical protein